MEQSKTYLDRGQTKLSTLSTAPTPILRYSARGGMQSLPGNGSVLRFAPALRRAQPFSWRYVIRFRAYPDNVRTVRGEQLVEPRYRLRGGILRRAQDERQ
jgi:hypothetical protein